MINSFRDLPTTNLIFKIGVMFIILSIIGLVTCFAAPWLESEIDGESEKVYYLDFEKKLGDEFEDYYGFSVLLAIIGYVFIMILGILCVLESRKNIISRIFINRRPDKDLNSIAYISTTTFILAVSLLSIIPIMMILIGGTRFVGQIFMSTLSYNSFQYTGTSGYSASFGTTAGYLTTIIGIIIFIFVIYVFYKTFKNLITNLNLDDSKFLFINKLSKLNLVILIISLIALITIPILSFINWYSEYTMEDYQGEVIGYKGTSHYNDGDIYLISDISYKSEVRDIFRDLSGNIGLMSGSLAMLVIISLLIFQGLILFSFNKYPKGSHYLIMLGVLFIIFIFLIFIAHILIINNINSLQTEINKGLSEIPTSLYIKSTEEVYFGYNYIPIISTIIICIFAFSYIGTAWPISVYLIKMEPTKELKEIPPLPVRMFNDRGSLTFFSVSCVILLIIGVGGGGYLLFNPPEKVKPTNFEEIPINSPYDLPSTRTDFEFNGYLDENTEGYEYFSLEQTEYVNCVRVRFNWEDESDFTRRYDNQPDEFQIILISPYGETFESPMLINDPLSGYGTIDFNTPYFEPPVGWDEGEDFENMWEIVIICGECGDQKPMRSITNIRNIPDNGNDWYLTVEVDHC